MSITTFTPRLRAATVHFVFSFAVVLAIALWVVMAWYPGVYAWASGLATLMLVLVSVDLVLGPLLTATVYKKGKKSLKFDLAVIVCVQLGALMYGVHAMYLARPAFIVFTMDRFEAVPAADIEPERLAKAMPEFRRMSAFGPKIVGTRMPDDAKLRSQILMSKVMSGVGLAALPEYYVPYEKVGKEFIGNAKPISELSRHNSADRVNSVLLPLGTNPDQLRYYPLVAREKDMTVIVDAKSGAMIDVVDLRPWS